MISAKDLAVHLGVGVSTVFQYGNTAGINIIKANQQLSLNEVNTIRDVHLGKFVLDTTVSRKFKNKISSSTETLSEFQLDNPFAENCIELIQNGNLFEGRSLKSLDIGNKKIETIFTDFEAASICYGLEDRHARALARKYNENNCSEEDVVELHTNATLALETVGGYHLSFALGLPPLPFQALDATQIFSELDKRKGKQKFPILRISFVNQIGEIEKIQISFYSEKLSDGRSRNENVITVKNQTTGSPIMKISRNGLITPEPNSKNIVPVLQLFIRFSKDTKSMIINYGLETGECSICGRELTDKESLRRGIGPVCAKN